MDACATALAPISKKEGDKKLWGYINDHPSEIPRTNWASFIFERLRSSLLSWQTNSFRTHTTLMGCIFFLEIIFFLYSLILYYYTFTNHTHHNQFTHSQYTFIFQVFYIIDTTLEGWVTPAFPTLLTDITICDRINLELEFTRGYGDVFFVNVVDAQHPVDHIEKILKCFILNKARYIQLKRELQLYSEDLVKDIDLIVHWESAHCSTAQTALSTITTH